MFIELSRFEIQPNKAIKIPSPYSDEYIPLLSHEGTNLIAYTFIGNDVYFLKYCDLEWVNNKIEDERFMLFPVEVSQLQDFFTGKISLWDILKNKEKLIFLDVFTDQLIATTVATDNNFFDVFADYMPSENSFFNEKMYEKQGVLGLKEFITK